MDKDSNSGSGGIPTNAVVALAIVVVGLLFARQAPLEGTRPRLDEPHRFNAGHIDARSWQDPHAAVAKARALARKAAPEKADKDEAQRTIERLAADVREVARTRPVEVLAVMLPGGPYSEDAETRRRTRYAVIAGLNASGVGLADPEHLGYVLPVSQGRSPTPIPYEWFDASILVAHSATPAPRLLVLWLLRDEFTARPLHEIHALAAPFSATGQGVNWHVFGPDTPDGLSALIDEAQHFTARDSDPPIRFYTASVSLPDSHLLPRHVRTMRGEDRTVSEVLKDRHVHLVRTAGDTATLADALVRELALRGLSPFRPGRARLPVRLDRPDNDLSLLAACSFGSQDAQQPSHVVDPDSHLPLPFGSDAKQQQPSHVALITEWDTPHGRGLQRYFELAMRMSRNEPGFCVQSYKYLRGLDGELPADPEASPATPSAGKQDTTTDSAARPLTTAKEAERAEGQQQFDYVRRLAARLRDADAVLRRSSRDGMGLRAVGVLGTDVHDKLLLLQALKPALPHAIFFTTGMDARYMDAREQAWARNLVVVSDFGLELNADLQGGAAPFRDSRQTAIYLTTRVALEDVRTRLAEQGRGTQEDVRQLSERVYAGWLRTPLVFEIGRTEPFSFVQRFQSNERCADIRCLDIHPPASELYPTPSRSWLFGLFSFGVFMLWAPYYALAKGNSSARNERRGNRARAWAEIRPVLVGIVLVLAQVALPLWMAIRWPEFAKLLTANGRPLSFMEGVSLWPTEGIRILTFFLCLYLLVRSVVKMRENTNDIATALQIGPDFDAMLAQRRRADQVLNWRQRLVRTYAMGGPIASALQRRMADRMPPDPLERWKRYLVENRLESRLLRSCVYVFVALALSMLFASAVQYQTFVPERGELSRYVHAALGPPVLLAMYFLVMFVVDATVICFGFVRALRAGPDEWPESTRTHFASRMGLPAECLRDWINLRFIGLRTRHIAGVIYYPFLIPSLLLVAGGAAFDSARLPSLAIATAAAGAVIALLCAYALRRVAEHARREAILRIDDAVMRARGQCRPSEPSPTDKYAGPFAGQLPSPPTLEQLEAMRTRFIDYREGLFAPFWQQPMLKALALPFAAIGGTTLLDYLALARL